MPIRLDDDGLQVAVSDQPSVAVRALLDAVDAAPDPLRARAAVRHPVGHRQQLPRHRRRRHPRRGLRGGRGLPSARPARPIETEVVADDAPIVQVVTRILTQAKRDRASDVHIEPSQDVVRVRFRIDGALKEVLMLPATMGVGLVSRIKIMAGMNIVERRRPQDGQLTDPDRRKGHRRPGVDGRHHLGREVRDADPRQEPFRPSPPRPRHAQRHPRDLLHRWSRPHSAWSCAPDRRGAARRRRSTPPWAKSAIRPRTS